MLGHAEMKSLLTLSFWSCYFKNNASFYEWLFLTDQRHVSYYIIITCSSRAFTAALVTVYCSLFIVSMTAFYIFMSLGRLHTAVALEALVCFDLHGAM